MTKQDFKPSNFIENQILEDLNSGKHQEIKTRFPPEPNGYLHIGHVKSIILNFEIAEKYNGACNLRFDDTNPTKEKKEFISAIKNDILWLGYKWSKNIKYSSNYFDIFYDCACELVTKGLAYVCFQTPEEMRLSRGTLKLPGENSKFRNNSPNQNLDLLERMKNGEFDQNECVKSKN